MVEHTTHNRVVAGSNPAAATTSPSQFDSGRCRGLHNRFATSPVGPLLRGGPEGGQHFLTWAQEQGASVHGGQVRLPRARGSRRDALTPTEVDRIEQAGRSDRDRLLVRLMAETAMRESEVASLRVQDLIAKEGR